MGVHILGIRHHGVGSAQMVRSYLEELKPDIVLVEGPPEISDQLGLIGHEDLRPPVALIVYDKSNLDQTSFYPFAEYSPEWVASEYAAAQKIPVRAIDLPAKTSFAIAAKAQKEIAENEGGEQERTIPKDPISYLADIAGYPSGESWWDDQFELVKSRQAQDHFASVNMVMKSLREEGIASSLDEENIAREAYMRHLIRAAKNEMYDTIAVVCGAWHAPALVALDEQEKSDNKLLKSLPKSKIKVETSWIPWTNSRLSRFSGYGAGISSPGWYEHRWSAVDNMEINWLSKVAGLFREQQVDISTAHVLEAYKLSHSLAVLRDHPVISFSDLHDAIRTVMCNGEAILFELIKKHLLVQEKIGQLPEDIPKVPLQQDFDAHIKTLRLKLSAAAKMQTLDLRKPLDLRRSIFFHRLNLLGVNWANAQHMQKKGSFKEGWNLEWAPEMQVVLIDKSSYGNTIENATEAVIKHKLEDEKEISAFVDLINYCVPAQLFNAMDQVLFKINQIASLSRDIKDLMKSLPSLIQISRYGDVRQTDIEQIEGIIYRLFSKVSVSLANTCYGLDEETSNEVFNLISNLDRSLKLIDDPAIAQQWAKTLKEVVDKENIHMVIKGCTIRLLFDQKQIEEEELSVLLDFHLSPQNESIDVAYWIEGFLRGSGLILIYDERIWNLIYAWVESVSPKQFVELLPILRRSFSKFPFGERRQIGQKAKKGLSNIADEKTVLEDLIDHEKAASILPHIQKFLVSHE